jgi:hypothetical protein
LLTADCCVNRRLVPYDYAAIFFAISRRRAAQNLPNKEFGLFERSEFPNSRQIRAVQGSPPQVDQVAGCPFFWFVFFRQVKKMNKKNKIMIFELM